MVSQYQRGRAKEYRAMLILKRDGWLVARSAASHGPVDLFAASRGKRLLIQVKSGKAKVNKVEIQELIKWANAFAAEAEVWHFKGRGEILKRRVRTQKTG
jgi:Holliday junction resolvase